MQKLTTPKAILLGLGLIALAIASVPYSSSLVKTAHASGHFVQRVAICDFLDKITCARVDGDLTSAALRVGR